MPKMYGVLSLGCEVCNIETNMEPYYGDIVGAEGLAAKLNKESIVKAPCTESIVVRVKFLPKKDS